MGKNIWIVQKVYLSAIVDHGSFLDWYEKNFKTIIMWLFDLIFNITESIKTRQKIRGNFRQEFDFDEVPVEWGDVLAVEVDF